MILIGTVINRWHVPDIKRLGEKADTLAKDLERQNDMLREIMKEVRSAVSQMLFFRRDTGKNIDNTC